MTEKTEQAQGSELSERLGVVHEVCDGTCFEAVKAEKERDELAMLVRKLATSLRKAAPDHSLPARAIDYLKRHNLQGSILR